MKTEYTYFDNREDGRQYLIAFRRELKGDEMWRAVAEFEPVKAIPLRGGGLLYLINIADDNWITDLPDGSV